MLRSTFLGYSTASSALKTSQNLLDVVGQNISNVNTEGYTRQRLDINSVSLDTSNLKYANNGLVIGQGVGVTSISQYRDSFLDLRYRTESAKSGSESVKLGALSDLESVFDEISMDGLDAQFSDLVEQLQSLTSSPTDPVIEGVVRTSASMLCQLFNNYSEQINTVKDQQTSYLKDGAIVGVNQLMKNIASLNKQIKEDNISGNPALELNDKRNTLIDELSSYLDIEVSTNPLQIGGGKTVDELSIKLKGNGMEIVNDDKFAELGVSETDGDVGIILKKNIDNSTIDPLDPASDKNFNDNDLLTSVIDKGQIAGYLEFINGKGEFDTSGSTEVRGVQYYESMLDTLANKFAEVMNSANSTDGSDPPDKPLFTARGSDSTVDVTTGITAGNIKVSNAWASSSVSYITNTKTASASGDSSGDTENILNMISLFQNKYDFVTGSSEFKGTMQEFFSYTSTNLSLQVDDVQKSYDTYSETQSQIDYSRDSMSSVSLDEEGVNLLTYSKSYNAAARLMTTLDDMLETLINTMAV